MAIQKSQKQIGSIPLSRPVVESALSGKAEGTKYTGAGDVVLEFGQANSFINESDSARVITLKVANASSSDCAIALCPGDMTISGYTNMADGTITTSVTGSARPSSFATFLSYVKNNPTRIRKIQLQVDDVAQYSEALLCRTYDPFKNSYDEVERIPQNYQSATDFNTKCVTIDDVNGWQFGPMSAILLNVQAGRTVTVAFVCGASFDAAKALNKKADEAAVNVSRVVLNA